MSGNHRTAQQRHRDDQRFTDGPSHNWLGYGFWVAYGLVILVTLGMGAAVLEAAKSMQPVLVTPLSVVAPDISPVQPVAHGMPPPTAPQTAAAMSPNLASAQAGGLGVLTVQR